MNFFKKNLIKILKIPAQAHRGLVRCTYKKNFWALRAIDSSYWREYTHAQNLSFINIDFLCFWIRISCFKKHCSLNKKFVNLSIFFVQVFLNKSVFSCFCHLSKYKTKKYAFSTLSNCLLFIVFQSFWKSHMHTHKKNQWNAVVYWNN